MLIDSKRFLWYTFLFLTEHNPSFTLFLICSYFFTQSELRCSYKECSYKKECIYIRSDTATRDVLEIFAKFTGKQLYRSLFFNKVAGLRHRCFPAKCSRTTLVAASVLTTPFLQSTAEWLLLLGVTFAIYR